MEYKDWNAQGKDSFTTPGGPFRRPAEGSARQYRFDRAEHPARQAEAPRPAARPASGGPSPFAPQGTQPWYEKVQAPPAAQAAPVISHDGEHLPSGRPDGNGPVYTIQLPQAPKPAPQKKASLWWVPLVVAAALLLGLALGMVLYPALRGSPSPVQDSGTAPISTEPDARKIYRENVDAVVQVLAVRSSPESSVYLPASAATGFLIRADGYLLTNCHVIKDAKEVRVTTGDGKQHTARLVAFDMEGSDLALLKIDGSDFPTVTLGSAQEVQVGDWVATIGNPLGELTNTLATGVISAGPRQIKTGFATLIMLQTNAAINKGNSGGPLFDGAGRVIGMVTAKYADYTEETALEGLGFVLPIDPIWESVQAWIEADQDVAAP